MQLSTKTAYGPVLKTTQLSAHAQNHGSMERCRISVTNIVLGDHDFPLTALSLSNFSKLTAFRRIFSHIFTAHAQKRLLMNFRLKLWPFDFLTPIFLWGTIFRRFEDVFC